MLMKLAVCTSMKLTLAAPWTHVGMVVEGKEQEFLHVGWSCMVWFSASFNATASIRVYSVPAVYQLALSTISSPII